MTLSITRKEILVDGLETSYLEAGSGKPVVLLHGGEFGGEAEVCWEHTIPALAERFRVVAPDLLGFGQTAKIVDFIDGRRRRLAHLARFLELVEATGAPCVGNSMGGMLLLYDAGSPEPYLRPEKIVSIAGGGALSTESAHFQALFAYDGSFPAMRRIVEALFHAPKWAADETYVERRRQSSLAPGAWEAVAAARFRRPVEVQEARTPSEIAYGNISAPTLIIAGADDKLKPKGWQVDVANSIPGARSILIADAGHCPQIEQSAITNEVLIRFLTAD